jgi:nucleotidyltransferase/DNA polymerase involved in DNA repair
MPTAAAKLDTLIVTKDELTEIAEWERKFADAKKKASAAEKEVKFRLLALAEKVLGVKTEADLKALTPDQVQKKFSKRLGSGDWRLAANAPGFSFSKTNEGRYPAWSQLFVEEMGETAAARIKAETPLSYSYCVEVSLP